MELKEKLIELRDKYVINQVKYAKLPDFEESKIVRYRVQFAGKVQNVGFRLEVSELAKRLGIAGYCRNMDNGNVVAQFQGEENKIQYLIWFMDNLKRIQIYDMKIEELDIVEL